MQFTTKIPERDGYYWALLTDYPVPFPVYCDGRGFEARLYGNGMGSQGTPCNLMDKLRIRVGDRIEMPEQSKVTIEQRTVTMTNIPTDAQFTQSYNTR